MSSEKTNLNTSFQRSLGPNVAGVLWFSKNDGNKSGDDLFPEYFKQLDYFLDGSLSRQGYKPQDQNVHFSNHFGAPFFLAQIPLNSHELIQSVKNVFNLLKIDLEKKERNDILLIGDIEEADKKNIQKKFADFNFINLEE